MKWRPENTPVLMLSLILLGLGLLLLLWGGLTLEPPTPLSITVIQFLTSGVLITAGFIVLVVGGRRQ